MQVSEVMSKGVCIANPQQSICDVARMMADSDVGAIPVGENDRLIGMVTDRDIAVRGVAQGMSPETKVSEVMSRTVKYCFEDEDIEHVAENMGQIQVHRLPVLNRDKRLVGILALKDLADHQGGEQLAGKTVAGISGNSGQSRGRLGAH